MKIKFWDEEERVWVVGVDGGFVVMFFGLVAVEGSVRFLFRRGLIFL